MPIAVYRRPIAQQFVDALRQDLRYGWRSLCRSPGFAGVIVLSLAAVIGANAALFGLADAMFLRRLALPHSDQLAAVTRYDRRVSVKYRDYRQLAASPGIPRIAGYRLEGASAIVDGDHDDLWVDLVTGNYFDLLGVRPLMGRVLNDIDERDATPVAVISERYWKRHLGGRADVLGHTMKLSGLAVTIVGVAPSRFTGVHFARRFDIALPFTVSPAGFPDARRFAVSLIARVDATRSRTAQSAALRSALERCCRQTTSSEVDATQGAANPAHPTIVGDPPIGDRGEPFSGTPGLGPPVILADASRGLTWGVDFRERYQSVLVAVSAGVLVLLLIACANIGTLLVSRAESREREFAVRLSLGATRARLARQLFIESLELAAMGAALGILAAMGATSLLLHGLPASAAGLGDVISLWPSWPMLAFTAVLALLCTIVVSIWPARRAARADLLAELAGARRRIAGGWTADRFLVITQLALSIVLVCSAALFVQTVRNLMRFDGGYRSRNVLLAAIWPNECASNYLADLARCFNDRSRDAARNASYDALRREASAIPGVAGVALTSNAPAWRDGTAGQSVRVPGATIPSPAWARFSYTTPGFFAATGVGLVAGRDFEESDRAATEPVVIVSQAFERRYFAGHAAVGQVVVLGNGATETHARIVGVARDANFDSMTGSGTDLRNVEREMCYQPLSQASPVAGVVLTLVLRTSVDPVSVAPALRRVVGGIPAFRMSRVASLSQVLNDAAVRERFAAALATVFGVIAVALAAIGVFGVLSYNVAKRTREIGVRMALGARPIDAFRLVFNQTVLMCGVGVALGLPLALASGWAARTQLYGVGIADPRVLLGGPIVLLLAAAVATIVLGRRAVTVDPMIALRSE